MEDASIIECVRKVARGRLKSSWLNTYITGGQTPREHNSDCGGHSFMYTHISLVITAWQKYQLRCSRPLADRGERRSACGCVGDTRLETREHATMTAHAALREAARLLQLW